jgi:uncharacterized repeat protein (TIGR03803 family)
VGGTLYGTTYGNPAIGNGTVFSVTPSGTETVLYSFKGGSDGAGPRAGLLEFNGLLYGTTLGGGNGNGTVFNVTLAGTETVVHSFQGGSDGKDPQAALINVHGTLYGTTIYGGAYGAGTVFKVTKTGAVKVVYSFGSSGANDGYEPFASLINLGGTLYGTTAGGGANSWGTVFAVTP